MHFIGIRIVFFIKFLDYLIKDVIKIELLGMEVYNNMGEVETENNDNMISTLKAVVVKVDKNNLLAMGIENGTELYSIGLNNIETTEFKNRQEILIYFNGYILESYHAQLGDIGNIEIVKDKSDVPIPDNILRFCYNSKNNDLLRRKMYYEQRKNI